MSLDNLHTDYHKAWQDLCATELRIEQRNAIAELGADTFGRILRGEAPAPPPAAPRSPPPPPLRRSASASRLEGHRRAARIQEAVQERISKEVAPLRAELRQAIAERRRLHEELKGARAVAAAASKPRVGQAKIFKMDPDYVLKPQMEPTKRAVRRVEKYSNGLMYFDMG
eukprot:TRINITY_DN56961_c0_g1_i1.p1 TRINITY_DN56961_c0_g1~~TRINITY_DN56961_c0_g1_i1.p1  ORF type:complete len:170 (-),score=43.99 TRINITY_DN56961_c0_g1_i1:6-515(-)